jgi:hypothetical protein
MRKNKCSVRNRTYRFLSSVAKHIRGNINSLALDLVGPSTVVTDGSNYSAHVAPGIGDGLAVIERLDGGKEILVRLKEVGELE